ncbi:MAG TPA: outer membrane beta-barrel protein [Vicinamibacteria bacterium]|nr:outer membrane beta-barrel protein [Vicinamibacteria bacterium]
MKPWILAGVLLSALPSAARSQTVEITPMAGYRFGGTLLRFEAVGGATGAGLEVGDSATFGVHLGYRIGDFEIEGLYARQATNLQMPTLFAGTPLMDLDLETFQAGGNYLIRTKDAKVVPFIGFGLGLTRLLPKPEGLSDETRFSASFAGGVKFWLGKHVGIRIEGRAFVTVLDSETDQLCGQNRGCASQISDSDLYQGEARGGLIFRF